MIRRCLSTNRDPVRTAFSSRESREMGREDDALRKQILGRMLHMLIRERRHKVIAMIVLGLVADAHAFDAGLLGGFFEVFGEELALFVEVVAGSLTKSSVLLERNKKKSYGKDERTTSMRISNGPPFHFLINSVASCSFHFSCWSSPKYPLNAFCPQGQLIGLQMGANAETDLYLPGLRRY